MFRGVLFSVLLVSQVTFANPSNEYFHLDDLLSLIQTKNLKTIDATLGEIPDSFKHRPVYIFASRSLHESNFQYPRVLLHTRNGDSLQSNMILSFNGHADQRGYFDLEIAEYSYESKDVNFIAVHFDPNGKNLPTIEKNPPQCTRCHMGRLIWDSHLNDTSTTLWPGIYHSSFQGKKSPKEDQEWENFRTKMLGKANRYRHFRENDDYDNAHLAEHLRSYHAKQLGRTVGKYAQTSPYRYSVLAAYDCLHHPFEPYPFPRETEIPGITNNHLMEINDAYISNGSRDGIWAKLEKLARQIGHDLNVDMNDPALENHLPIFRDYVIQHGLMAKRYLLHLTRRQTKLVDQTDARGQYTPEEIKSMTSLQAARTNVTLRQLYSQFVVERVIQAPRVSWSMSIFPSYVFDFPGSSRGVNYQIPYFATLAEELRTPLDHNANGGLTIGANCSKLSQLSLDELGQ